MAERSVQNDPTFDPLNIPERSGLLPSPGQNRKLLNLYEKDNKIKIPLSVKREWNKRNKSLSLARKAAATPAKRRAALTSAMEHSALSTYALGRAYTAAEIQGKGENMHSVAPDLDVMAAMKKLGKTPVFKKLDIPVGVFRKKHMRKFQRDIGKVSLGDPNLSDMDLSSDDETGC